MDKPLSNLGAGLRAATQDQISKLQRRCRVTTVYVTHDQAEAMAMGERVAVLREGRLQQFAARPCQPARERVRGLVHRVAGDEPVRRHGGAGRMRVTGTSLRLGDAQWRAVQGHDRVIAGVRPEHLLAGAGELALKAALVEEAGDRAALRRRSREGHPRDRSHPRIVGLPVDREGARAGQARRARKRKKLPVVQVTETPAYIYDHDAPRVRIGPTHTAYVKIAEGCDRPCSFCIIPKLRGPQRSRAIADIVAEAAALGAAGVREINLIAQDLTRYGWDAGSRARRRAATLAQLAARARQGRRRRLDPPPLHVPERVRRRADRRDRERAARSSSTSTCRSSTSAIRCSSACAAATRAASRASSCTKLRARIDDVVLRTTFIVGHPGETDAEFEELCEFVAESKFDRAGAFTYSIEPGTVSAMLPNRVDPEVSRSRASSS